MADRFALSHRRVSARAWTYRATASDWHYDRSLLPDVAEMKRMFVLAAWQGRGTDRPSPYLLCRTCGDPGFASECPSVLADRA